MDVTSRQERLDELAKRHKVPGASLAVWHDGELTEVVTGVLNKATGVEVTPDSLFQIGSISKVYTATLIMKLVDDLDTPVVNLLPEFRVRDDHATATVTVRHLLTHTSGIDGDFFHDTGPGDDCVQRYVAACAELPQIHAPGATMSYCNAGYVILGRIIEVLTGTTWDQALRSLLLEPAGLSATWTLAEEVLRFRAALGHIGPDMLPSPRWGLMRSMGPAGLINARASDVVAFARLHMTGGDGVLPADRVAAMQQPQVVVPDGREVAWRWGLGWILQTWSGTDGSTHRVYTHAGNTIGQSAMLYVLPDDDVVVVLLANGGDTAALQYDLISEIVAEHGIELPAPAALPITPAAVDPAPYAGEYERTGIHLAFTGTGTGLRLLATPTGPAAALDPPQQLDLVPLAEGLFVGQAEQETYPRLFNFFDLSDGTRFVHAGVRSTPRKAN